MINIFIGSSKESLDVASKIKKNLSNQYKCTMWIDDFFELNQSTYDTLVKKSIAYDYAIFVGGKDDLVKRIINRKKRKGIRDNVYFEFGLYAGVLSKERTFFFVDSNVGIASDLLGIDLIYYSNMDDIVSGCKKIKNKIESEERVNRIRLLPSTSLAYDYFNNFLNLFSLTHQDIVIPQKGVFQSEINSIKIIVPDNCDIDWEIWANHFYYANNCKDAIIKQSPRNVSIKYDDNAFFNKQKLDLFDIPLTLKASFWAVEAVIGRDYIGFETLLSEGKRKERINFIKTLDNLIHENAYLSKITQIITISDYKQIV